VDDLEGVKTRVYQLTRAGVRQLILSLSLRESENLRRNAGIFDTENLVDFDAVFGI